MNVNETRSSHPSSAQVETLVEFMERNPGMAKGFLRTQHARNRSRRQWEELAVRLNSIGSTIKTYKQWTKYWSDKKSAIKKKVAVRSAAMRRTGGRVEDEVELSELEERVAALCGGESSSTGDAHLGSTQTFPENDTPSRSHEAQQIQDDNDNVNVPQQQSLKPTGKPPAVVIYGSKLIEDTQSCNYRPPDPVVPRRRLFAFSSSSSVGTSQSILRNMQIEHTPPPDPHTNHPSLSPPPITLSHKPTPQPTQVASPVIRRRTTASSSSRHASPIASPSRRPRINMARRGAGSLSSRDTSSVAAPPPFQRRTEFSTTTESFLRVEEQQLDIQRLNAQILQSYLKGSAKRDRTLAEAVAAVGKGLQALADATNRDRNPPQVDSETITEDMPGILSEPSILPNIIEGLDYEDLSQPPNVSPAQVDSDTNIEDMPGTLSQQTSPAHVDTETDDEDMPRTSEQTGQGSSSRNEVKVFCPQCNTEVSHTAEGIQEDQTKILIAKVYHYFEQEYEELKKMFVDLDLTPLSKFRQRTALATGVSETTILQILKEEERRNAEMRRKPPQKRRTARKRRRQTDSSSEENSSDNNDDDIEQPSHADAAQTLLVKIEPPEHINEEPEIFLPTEVKLEPGVDIDNEQPEIFLATGVKVEPGVDIDNEEPEIFLPTGVKVEPGVDIDNAQLPMDPFSVDVKPEPDDDEVDTTTTETLARDEPAATKRKGRKILRLTDDPSTRQHTHGASSAPPTSSSAPLTDTLQESCQSSEREIKTEEIDEEGFS